MSDIVERLRDDQPGERQHQRDARMELGGLLTEAADEIEKLRAALRKIEYLDRAQVRGQPRRVSIQAIARAALGEKE